jgi:protein tyrosine/serine phosphatase
MNRHQNKIITMWRIVSALVTILILASCAHVFTASKQETGQIIKVSEGIYRGPRPVDLNELKSLKIHTILNLEDNSEAIQKESEAAEQLGMVMINIPMSGISRPKPADLLKAVKVIKDQDARPIYVHCLHGRDRTGFVIAADKIMHHGWSVKKAYQETVDNGHNRWFHELILDWKESLWLIASVKTSTQAIP